MNDMNDMNDMNAVSVEVMCCHAKNKHKTFLCDMSSDILSATYCSGPAISKEAARTRRGAEQAEEVESQTWILLSFISELQGYKAGGIAIGFM